MRQPLESEIAMLWIAFQTVNTGNAVELNAVAGGEGKADIMKLVMSVHRILRGAYRDRSFTSLSPHCDD